MPTEKDLDGIYSFMTGAYKGNSTMRWGNTPYFDSTRAENILSHQWSCLALLSQIRQVCPHLNALMDTTKVYEMILPHDLGEIDEGDVSLVSQLNGNGANKFEAEQRHIERLGANLPTKSRQRLLELFDDFENDNSPTKSIEALVATFIDYLQGNHFALIYGHNLQEHSDLVNKVVNKYFIPRVYQLVDALESGNHVEAATEIKEIFRHHIKQIQSAGIVLETQGFKKLLTE